MCLSRQTKNYLVTLILSYNPGQKSSGQYCNIHMSPSFLGSLLKHCILFKISLQLSLPPPYTKLKQGKNSGYTRPTLFVVEGRGWTCVNWKTPQECKSVSRLLSMVVHCKRVVNAIHLHVSQKHNSQTAPCLFRTSWRLPEVLLKNEYY